MPKKYTPSSPVAPKSIDANTPALHSYAQASSFDSDTPATAPVAAPALETASASTALAPSEADWEAFAGDFFDGMIEISQQSSLELWWNLTSQSLALDFLTKQVWALPLDIADAALTLAAAPIAFPLKVLDAAIAGTRSAAAGWAFSMAMTDKFSPEMDWRKKQAVKVISASAAFGSGVLTTMLNPKLKLFSQLKTQYNATVPLYTTGKIDTLKVASATQDTLATEANLALVTGYGKGELKELVKSAIKEAFPEPLFFSDTIFNWAAGTAIDSAASALSIGGKLASSRLGYGDYTLKRADAKNPEATAADAPSLAATMRELGRNQLKAITSTGFTAAAGGIAGLGDGVGAYGTRAAGTFVTALGELAKTTTSAIGDKNFDPMITVGNELTPGRHGHYNLDVEQGLSQVNPDHTPASYRNLIPAARLASSRPPSTASSNELPPVAGTSGGAVPQAMRGVKHLITAVNEHRDRDAHDYDNGDAGDAGFSRVSTMRQHVPVRNKKTAKMKARETTA